MLRPVGNRINSAVSHVGNMPYSPYYSHFYNSGTTSLAAAIIAAHKLKSNIAKPEVMIPAYGCPDLVSAIICAGAIPILVDIENKSPQLSLKELSNSITDKTIAIVAVRFFGIPERNKELSKIAKENNILLIDDSAQGFPVSDMSSYWYGDFIIISLGRGKPINLLGGGAVLTNNADLMNLLLKPSEIKLSLQHKIQYKLKIFLYNQTIRPLTYGLISLIPGIEFGQTVYKPLKKIEGINDATKPLLKSNLNSYSSRKNCQTKYRQLFSQYNTKDLIDLPTSLNYDMNQPLLRYPILIKDIEKRNAIYNQLQSYGVSLMYKKPLHLISEVDRLVRKNKNGYPNASLLAKQLLTLPTHEGVNKKTIQVITNTIQKCLLY